MTKWKGLRITNTFLFLLLGCYSSGQGIPRQQDPHRNLPPLPQPPLSPSPSVQSPLLDRAAHQMEEWADQNPLLFAGTVRNEEGCPVPSLTASLTVGGERNIMLQDVFLINDLASFNRERIPERVVHSKGHGAFGEFRVTHDISHLTKADFLNGIGKTTRIALRISTVAGQNGSPDTFREARGFALKFYTKEGIFDLVGNLARVFPIRDPILFNDLNKSRKKNPQTGAPDNTARWDFNSQRPETIMHLIITGSDYGVNSRVISGGGVHAFKLVNKEGKFVFAKFHFISQQPFRWWNQTEINIMSGRDPDYSTRDLYNAIENHDYPKWTVKLQVMTPEQALKYPVNPFDTTKLWREDEGFPMFPIGEFVLNENPKDHFNDMEQGAWSPERMVPGIEPSPDRMLIARMFSYPDAQRYRLGVNFPQLKVNNPGFPVKNYIRDGFMRTNPNGAGGPNYFPNSFHGPTVNQSAMESIFHVNGIVGRFDPVADVEDNYRQARLYLYKDLTPEKRDRVAGVMAHSLSSASKEIRDRALRNLFFRISQDFGQAVKDKLEAVVADVERMKDSKDYYGVGYGY